MTSNSSQPSLRPKPLDALVAAVVIALAVVTALLFYLPKTGSGDQLTLVITVGGQEQSRTPVTQLPQVWVATPQCHSHRAAGAG